MTRRVLTLRRAVDRYLLSLELEGRRPRGIESYRWVLDHMVDTLGDDLDPFSLSRGDMLDVAAAWGDVATNTRAHRISVLRSFSAWLVEEAADRDVALVDPASRLKRPRLTRPRRPRPEGPDAIVAICDACVGFERVVVWPLAMLGLRLSELRALTWRDVDETARVVTVLGKGGHQDRLPLPAPLAALFADERARRAEHDASRPDHFVVCSHVDRVLPFGGRDYRLDPTRPIGERTPRSIVKRVAERAGLPNADDLSPHSLRRGFADAYLRAHPGDALGLQTILRHRSITTTREYLADASIEDVAKRLETLTFVTAERSLDPSSSDPASLLAEATSGIEPLTPAGAEDSSGRPDPDGEESGDFVTPLEGVRDVDEEQ